MDQSAKGTICQAMIILTFILLTNKILFNTVSRVIVNSNEILANGYWQKLGMLWQVAAIAL